MTCQKCGEREGTEIWCESGAIGVVHGLSQRWCKRCCLKVQLDHALEVEASIGGLMKALEAEEAKS